MTKTVWKEQFPNVQVWLEEDIWGHRIYDESKPEHVTLEMLNVMSSMRHQGVVPMSQANGSYGIGHRHSLVLRTILFNNPHLREPLDRQLDNSARWERQFEALYRTWKQYTGKYDNKPETVERYNISGPEDFHYLREKFGDYGAYVRIVEILRQSSVAFQSNKRWTSKFLFPYGDVALFEDINNATFATDRRFFGRSGELAYLMLARSGYGPEIWETLLKTLFDEAAHAKRWERVIRPLMHDADVNSWTKPTPIGFLPYEEHPLFRDFGEDVLNLLHSRLPEYDAIPHLSRIVGFHLLHYILTIGASKPNGGQQDGCVRYVMEIRRDRNDLVRVLARREYQINNGLSLERMDAELRHLKESTEVQRALQRDDKVALCRWLLDNRWSQADKDKAATTARTAEELWHAFEDAAKRKHLGHLGDVHHEYARSCGLASREGTRAYRYCPSDGLLRTIVLANVRDKMEYDAFLDRLFRRYGFVIAKRHAATMSVRQDLGDFDANDRRLRNRLANLGLLRIMSDDLAFVVNRYRSEGNI